MAKSKREREPLTAACWHCGQVKDLQHGFCRTCRAAGNDYMMISCTVCESVATRRQFRGQQLWTCKKDREQGATIE